MPSRDPQCLNCISWEDQYNQVVQDYEIADRERRRALRRVAALERELHGSTTKESEEIREVLTAWDEHRHRLFPGRRAVILDMAGDRAKAVRSMRRKGQSHQDMLDVIRGAELSSHHTGNPDYWEITSLLREDKRVEKHKERAWAYDRLLKAGFSEDRARALIHAGVDKSAQEIGTSAARRCPGCGRDPELDGCFCGSELMRSAA